MDQDNLKVIHKIKKLLSLSESSNENEARVAMLKAQELLVKHKLTMKEVKDTKVKNSKIKDYNSNVTFTKAKWKARLASVIADNFGCFQYFRTNKTHRIVFFGREEDVIVCNIVLDYALDCIESSTRRLKNKYKREKLSTKGIENDYALGFINGLYSQFENQKKDNEEWGLVLVKDEEVVKEYKNKKFTRSISTTTKFQGNIEVSRQGFEDGEKFKISDKIAENEEDILLI